MADLTTAERKSLVSIAAGNLKNLSEKSLAPLVALRLVEVDNRAGHVERWPTEHGRRLAGLCQEAAASVGVKTAPLFDIGPPDPKAVARVEARGGRVVRR